MRLIPATASSMDRELLRRRAIGLVLVVIIHILGFLLLLSLAPQVLQRITPDLKSFPLMSYSEKPAPKPAARSDAPRGKTQPVPKPQTPVPVPPLPTNLILMTSEQFRATDIANIRPQRADSSTGHGGAGNDVAEGPGEGPGGAKLYPADWYREPTTAEMAFYLKDKRQAGWAMIACRTAPDFRVEDCREMTESPSGSGLAGALRQAAWQFRVRPPRIGGKPQMGVWVRILFDFQVGVIK